MSPFLAQVQVIAPNGTAINAATPSAPEAMVPPPSPGTNDHLAAEIRANVAAITANAKAVAAAAKAKAKADLEQARQSTAKAAAEIDEDHDKDDEGSGDTTIRSSSGSVVVHHKKSDGGNAAEIAVPIVAIFFVFSWLIVKAVMAPFGHRIAAKQRGYPSAQQSKQGLTEEEQAILLKLQRTIGQMESRIESLETILIDETRTKEKYGTKL